MRGTIGHHEGGETTVAINLTRLAHLPDDAQLWIYGFSSPLNENQKQLILTSLEDFCVGWRSHTEPVHSAYEILFDRFVVLAGWASGGISGCSIDSSVRVFTRLRDRHGINGLDRNRLYYRDGDGKIRSASPQDFRSAAEAGEIHTDTSVFDTTIAFLKDFRAGCFEMPCRDSWHFRAFVQRAVEAPPDPNPGC